MKWTNDFTIFNPTRLRLGLERGSTAEEALNVITQLLEKYGQGGPCSATDPNFSYHNSFLIADPTSAWVLETSGKHWVAEHVDSGYRNISNTLTITTKIDRKSNGIEEYAKSKQLWSGQGEFNFCEVFSGERKPGDERFLAGERLLKRLSSSNSFRETDMFRVLRDTVSGICRPCHGAYPTVGSQVSTLTPTLPCVHWFTGTVDPSKSVFKPFIFTKNSAISNHTKCPDKNSPHTLHILHSEAQKKGTTVQSLLKNMEDKCVKELEGLLEKKENDLTEFDELMKDCVETEVKFYC